MSKNAEGWIRHRGGKCPVEIGTPVDVRYRNGNIDMDVPAQTIECHADNWLHTDDKNSFDARCDIMAYRLHKPAEQVDSSPRKCEGRGCSMPDSGEHSQECLLDAALEQGWAGPCEWRDRITEIDATTQALTTERANLVQKLASEGFALIGRINDLLTDAAQKHEDMSDWRNWKIGDLLEMVKAGEWEEMTNGKLYEFASPENGDNFAVVDDGGELRSFRIGSHDYVTGDFKWHSRPSA